MNKIFKHRVISYDETKVKQQFGSAMLCVCVYACMYRGWTFLSWFYTVYAFVKQSNALRVIMYIHEGT